MIPINIETLQARITEHLQQDQKQLAEDPEYAKTKTIADVAQETETLRYFAEVLSNIQDSEGES